MLNDGGRNMIRPFLAQIAVAGAVLVAILAAGGCMQRPCQMGQGLKEVSIRVAEIPNGVVVSVTSAKPDRVKRIREHWAQKQKANRMAVSGRAGPAAQVVSIRLAVPDHVKAVVASSKRSVKPVDMAALKAALDSAEDALIVDVREPFEYVAGHVPGAVNIPRGLLEFAIWEKLGPPGRPALDTKIYLYCLKAGRALLAARSLRELGCKNAVAVDMTLADWQQKGYPLE
jgi:rhodanese-related sulfurtransferase